jgi:hypothetical protein
MGFYPSSDDGLSHPVIAGAIPAVTHQFGGIALYIAFYA